MEIVEYNITDAAIAKMEDLYMGLTVSGLDDKEGFDSVHSGRMVVRGKRIEVEKKRKIYKADSLAWGRKVDTEAKRIFALLKPIEDYLQKQEDTITKEKERIHAEKEAAEKIKIEERVTALFAMNVNIPYFDAAMLSDTEYETMLDEATNNQMAERLRIQEEEKAKEKEEARLAEEKANQEAEANRLAEIQTAQESKERELKEQQKAIENEKQRVQEAKGREIFEKQAQENARLQAERNAEKERIEQIAKVEETRLRSLQAVGFVYQAKDLGTMPDKKFFALHNKHKKAWDKKQKEILAEKIEQDRLKKERATAVEKARFLAMLPDKEKLTGLAMTIRQIISPPDIASEAAKEIVSTTLYELASISDDLVRKVEEL